MSAGHAVRGAVAGALQGWSGSGRIWVGFSGGMDSSVLLHAASRLQPAAVAALHVNHGLQSAANDWQAHCQSQCAQWSVPLRSHTAVVSQRGNLEASARAARYAFFASEVGANDLLLLAHHRDDQAETVLLRLLQGRGFYGMPKQRRLPAASGQLLRPFLELPQQALREYAGNEGVRWVDDPSNAEIDGDRNYLRHRVLPELRQRWSAIDEVLVAELADRQRVDAALLAAMDARGHRLCLDRLPAEPDAAVQALRIWLASRGERLPTRRALADFMVQLASPRDRQPVLQLGATSLRRYGNEVHHVLAAPVLGRSYALTLPGSLRLPHGELTAVAAGEPARASVAAVEFVGDHPGAWILVRGHRRRVRELLHAARVPPWRRDSYPLVVDGYGVVAVPGIAQRDGSAGYVCNWSEIAELH